MKNFILLDASVVSTIANSLASWAGDIQFAALNQKDEKTLALLTKQYEDVTKAQEALMKAISGGDVISENEKLKAQIDDLTIQLADLEMKNNPQ